MYNHFISDMIQVGSIIKWSKIINQCTEAGIREKDNHVPHSRMPYKKLPIDLIHSGLNNSIAINTNNCDEVVLAVFYNYPQNTTSYIVILFLV